MNTAKQLTALIGAVITPPNNAASPPPDHPLDRSAPQSTSERWERTFAALGDYNLLDGLVTEAETATALSCKKRKEALHKMMESCTLPESRRKHSDHQAERNRKLAEGDASVLTDPAHDLEHFVAQDRALMSSVKTQLRAVEAEEAQNEITIRPRVANALTELDAILSASGIQLAERLGAPYAPAPANLMLRRMRAEVLDINQPFTAIAYLLPVE